MKRNRLVLGVVLVFVLVAGNLWQYVFKPVAEVEGADLIFNTLKGERISFNGLNGKPVLVTFWATSCGVCMADLPQLTALHEKYASKGLEMFSVAMPYDKEDKVRAVAKRVPFHVVLDSKAVVNNAFGQIMFTPTNVLIKPTGEVALMELGPFDVAKFETEIKGMI